MQIIFSTAEFLNSCDLAQAHLFPRIQRWCRACWFEQSNFITGQRSLGKFHYCCGYLICFADYSWITTGNENKCSDVVTYLLKHIGEQFSPWIFPFNFESQWIHDNHQHKVGKTGRANKHSWKRPRFSSMCPEKGTQTWLIGVTILMVT